MSQDHANMPGMEHPAKPEPGQTPAKPQKPQEPKRPDAPPLSDKAKPQPTTGKS